jgi:enamine deaminase RidA (YjgF/YER057c/UK114 family)
LGNFRGIVNGFLYRMIERLGVTPTYSEAVIHNGTVYLSGQVPWKSAGKNIQEQTKEVLELIDARLFEAGSDRTKLLSMQIFLKNSEDYSEMNKVFVEWLPSGAAPARNTICGIMFPKPEWSIEIVVVAAV